MNNLKKTWDNVFQNKTWGEFPAEDLIRFFSKFNHFKNPHVLEIGCGPGGNINFFITKNIRYTGIDISSIAIKNALKKYKKIPDLTLINNDFIEYNFDKNKYNFLVDNCSSCCLPFQKRIYFYEKISKSLKKNGVIFMRTFSNKCILNIHEKIKANEFFEPKKILNGVGKINFLNKNNIFKIFNQNFKIIYLEEITRSLESQKFLISEWIVYAKKH